MSEKKYSKDHEWIEIDNDIATIGITNHAQESLGDIVFVELPTIGKQVSSNDEVCVIESVKAASDIYSPLKGEITEVNNKLETDASIINQDAENAGWIFKIKVTDPNEFDSLLSNDEYKKFLEQ